MERQAHFNPEVSRAVYMKDRKTERCIEHLPSTHLVSEDEIASRTSEFQDVHRIQKRQLHEYHAQRKKCRLHMRQDITDAFWFVYEQEVWDRLIDATGTPDITADHVDAFLFEVIRSCDKNEIVRLWREKCMMMDPVIEQHEMVPFHDRWIQQQFKEEGNVKTMKERLKIRANNSSHWLTDLVDELITSPDTPSTQDFNFEALDEFVITTPETSVNFQQHENFNDLPQLIPGVDFIDLSETEPMTEFNFEASHGTEPSSNTEQPDVLEDSDEAMIHAMECWEEEELSSAIDTWDYSYLLGNEVS